MAGGGGVRAAFARSFPVACLAQVRLSRDSPLYHHAGPSATGLAEWGEPSWDGWDLAGKTREA